MCKTCEDAKKKDEEGQYNEYFSNDSIKTLDAIGVQLFGRKLSESLENDICIKCGNHAEDFKSDKYEHHYFITGVCKTCHESE